MTNRYEREIEEILEQAGDVSGAKKAARGGGGFFRGLRQGLNSSSGGGSWQITPARVFMVSIALLLTALLMSSLAPGLVPFFGWGGLVLFIIAYALFFARPGKAIEKRWRGRVVEERPTWRDRFRRLLRR